MPVDWLQVPLGEVCRIEIGGTPSRNVPRFWADKHSGYPWLSIADLKASRVYDTAERITDAGVRNSNVKPIPANTPVMSFKLTIGRAAVAGVNMYSNEAIAAFHADSTVIAPGWLFYELPRAALRGISDTAVKGSTLNKAKLRKLPLELPPLPEQRQIAEILDTLDEAIRKTEQIIAKLQQVKQGLLHDLLTRGIDDNGELRDPDRHPEQFKDSPLGRIPKGWEGRSLADVGKWTSGGTPAKGNPAYWDGQVPWVSPKDMKVFRLFETQDTVTIRGVEAGSRLVPPGSVFIVVRGMILAHTFPVCIAGGAMAFNQDVKGIVPAEALTGEYLAHWFMANADLMLGLVTEATHGTKRLDLGDLHRQSMALPPLEEQEQIADILRAKEARIDSEHAELSKLRLLKSGLMEDLLTGRVRVTKLLEQAAE